MESKVLIKTDDRNVIVDINSDFFITNLTDWVCIDMGIGDRYAHAQSNYLQKPLCDNLCRYNYKYVDGSIVELTEIEKAELFPELTVELSFTNRLEMLETAMQEMILMQIGGE